MTPLDFKKVGPGTCWNELRSENLLAVPNLIEKVHAATDEIDRLKQQLAECQAQEAKLREAVNHVIANGVGTHSILTLINALAIPRDATALNELIEDNVAERTAEVEKQLDAMRKAWNVDELIAERTASLTAEVERLKAALTPKPPRDDLVPHAYELEATHNNAEFWYRAGHSEEAAAKGESVICMAQAVFAWKNAAYAKAKEAMKLRQQNAELTAQRDAAMKDAERWRKARKTGVAKRGATDLIVVYNERADEAIDAAIANGKGGAA